MPLVNPCASSTKRKYYIVIDTIDDSINSTRESSVIEPAAKKEEIITPEQLGFTAATSKAMSKELAPLIARRDQTRARPTVYKSTKDGTVDCDR